MYSPSCVPALSPSGLRRIGVALLTLAVAWCGLGAAPTSPEPVEFRSTHLDGVAVAEVSAPMDLGWLVGLPLPQPVAGLSDTPAAVPPGAYEFLSRDPYGRPLRYDPCRPVRYAINPAGAPAGAVEEVREMFWRAGFATGIQFVDAGDTSETHLRYGAEQRPSYQPQRYGSGVWAPILVTWASEVEEPRLAGPVVGYGGSSAYWLNTTDPAFVTGEIVFDRDSGTLQPGFGPGRTRGNVVAHELAHVLGLHHVVDATQLMNPSLSTSSPDGYRSGDLAGLAALGRGAGCLTVATPR